MASILCATPCASESGHQASAQRQGRQGRTSTSGYFLAENKHTALPFTCAHGLAAPVCLNTTAGYSQREKGHLRTHRSPLLFYFEQTQTEFRARLGGPILPVEYPPPLRARQAVPGSRLHGRLDDPLLWQPSVRAGGQGGSRPLAAGKLWAFLTLGPEGGSPRLLPIPFVREQKIPTGVAGWTWGGRSSTRFGRIWARTLVPRCQPSQLQIRGRSCPIAQSRKHKKAPKCTKLGSNTGKWPHTEKRYARRSRSKRRSSDPATKRHQLRATGSRTSTRYIYVLAVCSEALSFGDPPIRAGNSQLTRYRDSNTGHSSSPF